MPGPLPVPDLLDRSHNIMGCQRLCCRLWMISMPGLPPVRGLLGLCRNMECHRPSSRYPLIPTPDLPLVRDHRDPRLNMGRRWYPCCRLPVIPMPDLPPVRDLLNLRLIMECRPLCCRLWMISIPGLPLVRGPLNPHLNMGCQCPCCRRPVIPMPDPPLVRGPLDLSYNMTCQRPWFRLPRSPTQGLRRVRDPPDLILNTSRRCRLPIRTTLGRHLAQDPPSYRKTMNWDYPCSPHLRPSVTAGLYPTQRRPARPTRQNLCHHLFRNIKPLSTGLLPARFRLCNSRNAKILHRHRPHHRTGLQSTASLRWKQVYRRLPPSVIIMETSRGLHPPLRILMPMVIRLLP